MNQFATAALRTLGMFLAVLGALGVEKYLDTMKVSEYNFMPFGVLLFGLILFYSVKD